MNPNISKLFVKPIDTIELALKTLAANKTGKTLLPAGIVLIVNNDRQLIGIATDGDIRRALSSGVAMDDPISKIMNSKPFLIEGPKSNNEILALAANKIKKEHWHKDRLNKIIIVDKEKRVIDLVSFYDLLQKSDVRFKQIGLVGLGYVGLTLALTLADLGFKVFGFDSDADVSRKLRRGQPHFFENGLEQILKDNLNKNFKVVENFEGENNCDVYFVAVGTPLNQAHKPDLKYLREASIQIGKILKAGDGVILRSTVPLGTTRNIVAPLLEKYSQLKAGEDFFVAFAPERTVAGKALEELRQLPQVIGGINWASADLAANIFNHLTHSVVLVDSLEEAEIVKLINNTYRDVVFSFANEVSLVCQRFGIDTHRVIEAANRDYGRSQVPLPSPGVGGACLQKDPFIFMESAKAKKYSPLLAQASRQISNLMIDFVSKEIVDFIKKHKNHKVKSRVLILGFAFKGRPVTSDTRGSMAAALISKLQCDQIAQIQVYDPVVEPADIKKFGALGIKNIKAGFSQADVIVVMNNNPAFSELNIRQLLALAKKPVFLFDAWGIYSKEETEKVEGVVYKRL